jgi:hypothetical protein
LVLGVVADLIGVLTALDAVSVVVVDGTVLVEVAPRLVEFGVPRPDLHPTIAAAVAAAAITSALIVAMTPIQRRERDAGPGRIGAVG